VKYAELIATTAMSAATSEVTADRATVLRSIINYHTTMQKPCPGGLPLDA
jgi:hypothetical protein